MVGFAFSKVQSICMTSTRPLRCHSNLCIALVSHQCDNFGNKTLSTAVLSHWLSLLQAFSISDPPGWVNSLPNCTKPFRSCVHLTCRRLPYFQQRCQQGMRKNRKFISIAYKLRADGAKLPSRKIFDIFDAKNLILYAQFTGSPHPNFHFFAILYNFLQMLFKKIN